MADLENEFDQAEQTVLSSYADALSGGSELMMTMPALADAGMSVQGPLYASMQNPVHMLCVQSPEGRLFVNAHFCIRLVSCVRIMAYVYLLTVHSGSVCETRAVCRVWR